MALPVVEKRPLRLALARFEASVNNRPISIPQQNSPLYDAAVSQHLGRLEHRPHFVWETQLAVRLKVNLTRGNTYLFGWLLEHGTHKRGLYLSLLLFSQRAADVKPVLCCSHAARTSHHTFCRKHYSACSRRNRLCQVVNRQQELELPERLLAVPTATCLNSWQYAKLARAGANATMS